MRVTIVPSDKRIILNNEPLTVDTKYPEGVHAIQWNENKGHIEYTDTSTPNEELNAKTYGEFVAPFVKLFTEEKARQEKIMEEYRILHRPDEIRLMRNSLLADCDYLLAEDYPISEATKKLWIEYRTKLRNITNISGFPWNGAVDAPWPTPPKATK